MAASAVGPPTDRIKPGAAPSVCMSDMGEAMRRFPVPDHEDLPDDIQERIDAETDRAGFTPNVFRAMAYRPEQFRAFFAYHDALVEATELEREEIALVVVAVSGANDCLYCVVAHGALLRIYADDPRLESHGFILVAVTN